MAGQIDETLSNLVIQDNRTARCYNHCSALLTFTLEMRSKPNPNRTNRTRTLLTTEPNPNFETAGYEPNRTNGPYPSRTESRFAVLQILQFAHLYNMLHITYQNLRLVLLTG
jgi:hypothetical protein